MHSSKDWEKRRATIKQLYITLGRPLEGADGVIETMAEQGFIATVQEYQYRFRIWGLKKRKKQARTDPQELRCSHTTRMHHGNGSASYENEDIAEAEVIHTSELVPRWNISTARIDITATPIANNSEVGDIASTWYSFVDSYMDMTNPIGFDHSLLPHNAMGNLNLELSPYHAIENYTASNYYISQTNHIGSNLPPYDTNDLYPWLWHLPSTKLVSMAIESIYSQSLADPFSNAPMTTTLFCQIVNATIRSDPDLKDWRNRWIPVNFFSLNVFAGENWSQFGTLSDEVALAARFDGRLVAAVVNAFAGLPNIPPADVLELLNRHPATQSVVTRYLSTSLGPMAKAFAENVFRACIEYRNPDKTDHFLHSRLVDPNQMVCHYQGERYTPVEFAAIKQSFQVLRLFIKQGVDVNRSFPRAYQSNALYLLIRHVENHQATLSNSFLSLVDNFLIAGATILIETISLALRFTDSRLTIVLIKKVTSQRPQIQALENGLLRDIVKEIQESAAKEVVELVIDNYSSWNAYKIPMMIDRALDAAIDRGYGEAVATLSPYVSPPRAVLKTVMDEGNRLVVEPIQRTQPGMEDPGLKGYIEDNRTFLSALELKDQNLLCSPQENDVSNLHGHELGVALMAALEAGNLKVVNKLLDLDPDFEFYESCRSSNGCCTYIGRDQYDSQMFDASGAMSAALAHNFDDIAWRLLALSLTTRSPMRRVCTGYRKYENLSSQDLERDRRATPLYVAVRRKKPEFVKAILEFDFDCDVVHRDIEGRPGILELALESGEDSIINDLWEARRSPWDVRPSRWEALSYPSFLSPHLLQLALKRGRADLFLDLVQSGSLHLDTWQNTALESAVICEDESVLDGLVSLGAAADNDYALKLAVKKNPSMVKPLLDRFWKAYPQGRAGYGANIVEDALSNYSSSPSHLNKIFTWDLVTLNATSREDVPQGYLLGKAIETHECHIVKEFISAGYNVNSFYKDQYSLECRGGTTPLLDAIDTGMLEMVQLLLDHGARVNEPIQFGIRRTPLQKAAENNDIPILCLLLGKGAKVNAAPALFSGGTALQFAAIHGNCEMAAILINRGAVQHVKPPIGRLGRWPLEGAAENGRFDMIELLWRAHEGPFDEALCRSAMRLAEINGHFGCKEKIEELMAISS